MNWIYSRELFWGIALLGTPLVTWGLGIFLSDDLGVVKGDAALVFTIGFPVALTLTAGRLTRRSWREAAGGAGSSLLVLLALAIVLFLTLPEDIFR